MPKYRQDPINKYWVVYSNIRSLRPNSNIYIKQDDIHADCPFCPGKEFMTPEEIYRIKNKNDNGQDWEVRVVPNKYPAFEQSIMKTVKMGPMPIQDFAALGKHELIIETPEHGIDIFDFKPNKIAQILKTYQQRILDLKNNKSFKYFLIYRNNDFFSGASQEHAHSQLIATEKIPDKIRMRMNNENNYYKTNGHCYYCNLAESEAATNERIILLNEDVIVLAPYASRFPYEMHIFPRVHEANFEKLTPKTISAISNALHKILSKYKTTTNSKAHNIIINTAPAVSGVKKYSHCFIEVVPRQASIAGFELGSGIYMNSVFPESAAKKLRQIN